MPTYLVGPTRPYTTITAALTAATTAMATISGVHQILVDAGTYNETPSPSSGFSSSSNYISLEAAPGSEHNGNINSGVIIVGTSFSATLTTNSVAFFRAKNLIIRKNHSGGVNGDSSCLSYGQNTRYENCILVKDGDGYGYGASTQVGNSSTPPTTTFINCLAINLGTPARNFRSTGFRGGGIGNNGAPLANHNLVLINCGSYNFYESIYCSTASVCSSTVINCWGYNNNAGSFPLDFGGNLSASCSNNASRDATAPGANSITNLTLAQAAFTSVSGNNFHISQHSSLYAVGSNQSASFTTDWDNETITTWSIGPDAQAGTNNCLTDSFDYTINTTSAPWKSAHSVAGPLVISNRCFWHAYLMERTAYNTSDGYVASFSIRRDATSDGRLFFGPSRSTSPYNGGHSLAAVEFGTSFIKLGGTPLQGMGGPLGTFGGWSGQTVNIDTGDEFTVTLYYKNGYFAASIIIDNTRYSSGFVATLSGDRPYQLVFVSVTSFSYTCSTGSHTYRLGLTDDQVDDIYNGQMGQCTDPAPVPTTSSSPWINQNTPHEEANDAEPPQLRTKSGEPSPSRSRSGRDTTDAKTPNLKTVGGQPSPSLQSSKSVTGATVATKPAPKGYKDGFISIMPESGGYSASSLTLGTGNKPHFYSDNLGINKEFVNCGCVTPSRAFKSRVDVGQDPSGGFVSVLKSNDCIPLLQSHFQKRIGTTPATGTTYYEFSPNRGQLLMTGSSFGTGSYNSTGTWSAFTVSAYKAIEGSAYHFKTGVCDKLGFSFDARGEALVMPNISFKDVEVLGTNTGLPTGSASSLEPFYGHQFSVDFLGLPVIKFDIESKNNLKKFRRVGTSGFNHQFGRYEVTGQATVDLAKVSLAHFGSMLGASSFAVVGTLYGDERNKMVFDMPNVVLKPYELNLNTTTVNIPFSCYESEDGGTAPLTIKLWTRNYSGTSFEPN